MEECEKSTTGIIGLTIMNRTDVKTVDPLILKRKYGAFTRPVFKIEFNEEVKQIEIEDE